jgi:hypothetical protein
MKCQVERVKIWDLCVLDSLIECALSGFLVTFLLSISCFGEHVQSID